LFNFSISDLFDQQLSLSSDSDWMMKIGQFKENISEKNIQPASSSYTQLPKQINNVQFSSGFNETQSGINSAVSTRTHGRKQTCHLPASCDQISAFNSINLH